MFHHLEIETIGKCNRTCQWCMRNTEPNRAAVASYFSGKKLPLDDIRRVLQESADVGFNGRTCLSHYNEPLTDDRIVEIASCVKNFGFGTLMCSNADLLTESLASELDEVFDAISFSFYMDRPLKDERMAMVSGWFSKCALTLLDGGHIIPTHFSGCFDVVPIAGSYSGIPCFEPDRRCIINHQGKMLLCCEDLIGRFGLPTIYDGLTIGEMWSGKRASYAIELSNPGGRTVHEHCLACPRPT